MDSTRVHQHNSLGPQYDAQVFTSRRTYCLKPQSFNGLRAIGGNGPIKKTFQERTDETEKKSIYKEFLGVTSIPGFSQFGRQKNTFGKVYWVLMFVTGIGLAMYQSSGLIQDYFKYITYQQSVLRMNASLPFPAITVCNRAAVKWATLTKTNHKLKRDWEEIVAKKKKELTDAKQRKIYPIEERFVKENALLQSMRDYQLSDAYQESDNIFYNVSDVCGITRWNHIESVYGEEYFTFFHPFYGNCFTFNSGMKPGKPPQYVDPASDLIMAFFINRKEEPQFLVRTSGVAVLIHESGTPPILNSALVQLIYPGEWMKMSINMQQITRLPAPYPANCTDKFDLRARREMVYYTEKTPYLYSSDGCRTTCMQNRTFEKCNCLQSKIPSFPVRNLELCIKEENECNKDRGALHLETCPCPLPCTEFRYRSQHTYEKFSMQDGYWREAAQFYFGDLMNLLEDKENYTLLESHIGAIQVIFETVMFEDTSEQAKYTIADFWGAVGGNIGFWTGISVLSLMEVTELFAACFTKFKNNILTNGGQKNGVTTAMKLENRYVW